MQILYGENLTFLESLNLKNGNNSILSVELPCEFEGEPCELTELHCVTVDDEDAAINNEPPYSSWSISADFVYSEDCTLGIASENIKGSSVYPNPTNDILVLSSPTTEILRIKILNLQGKLLSSYNSTNKRNISIDVSSLSSGMYFLNLENNNGVVETKKFIKN